MNPKDLQTDKVDKLITILSSIDQDAVHIQDIQKLFEAILESVVAIKGALTQEMIDHKTELNAQASSLMSTCDDLCAKLTAKCDYTDMQKMAGDIRSQIEDVVTTIESFPDLKLYGDRIAQIENMITLLPKTVTPDELTTALNGFKKEIQTELESVRTEVKKIPIPSSMGMRKVPIVRTYNLTSQCDGNTKSFVLPLDTTKVLGVFGTQFPIQFDPANDWTFSGRTLTLGSSISAPASGQTLWALIEVLFYGK